MSFSGGRQDVVRFVADMLLCFGRNSPVITVITRGSSEEISASIAIGLLSEDIAKDLAASYSLQLTIT